METPSISIVIPVHDDRKKIAQCLQSLSAQTYPKEKVELIVVDDGSTDGLREWLPERFPGVRYLHKERTGPDDSRNKGIEIASGEILGFIDSDCIAPRDWLEEGISALTKENVSIVTGSMLPGGETIQQLMGILQFGHFLSPKSRDTRNFITANLLVRKWVVQQYRFPPSIMGGDRLLSWRLHKAGFRIRYHGPMRVFHFPDLKLRGLVRRIKRYDMKTLYLREIDPSLPGGSLIRIPVVSPILIVSARFCRDILNLLKYYRPVGASPGRIPVLAFLLFVMRMIDLLVLELLFFKKRARSGRYQESDFFE